MSESITLTPADTLTVTVDAPSLVRVYSSPTGRYYSAHERDTIKDLRREVRDLKAELSYAQLLIRQLSEVDE